jgi:DNA-directed RNA polymerase specialized sigma24 family protein
VAERTTAIRRHRAAWQPVFLAAIRDTGNVRLAAQAAGVDRTTPYVTARRDPAFAAAWQAAEQDAIDVLEATARKRALESSDQLLMFLLRAHRPEKYRDTVDLRVDVRRGAEQIAERLGVPVETVLERLERKRRELES